MEDFKFENKVVFILSPDRWGTMRISKHHYALLLAKKGNTVIFVEPPDLNNKGITITKSNEESNLSILSYKPIYRAKRFLPSIVYDALQRLQIYQIIKAVGAKPDIVWCFDPYRYKTLSWFGASVKIFFAADRFSLKELPHALFTADICFGVSDTICAMMKPAKRPTFFINHGLNTSFSEAVKKRFNSQECNKADNPVVGYVGNLLREANDHATMKQVIQSNPSLHFIFWGQYIVGQGGLGSFDHPDVTDFISFLQEQKNVELRGPLPPSVLQQQIHEADMFWLCWKISDGVWDGSNSHKILEYLSTGKPVVSHNVSTYHNSDLFYMLDKKTNENYVALFSKVVDIIKQGEEIGLKNKRLLFCLENTYANQLSKIESYINSQKLVN